MDKIKHHTDRGGGSGGSGEDGSAAGTEKKESAPKMGPNLPPHSNAFSTANLGDGLKNHYKSKKTRDINDHSKARALRIMDPYPLDSEGEEEMEVTSSDLEHKDLSNAADTVCVQDTNLANEMPRLSQKLTLPHYGLPSVGTTPGGEATVSRSPAGTRSVPGLDTRQAMSLVLSTTATTNHAVTETNSYNSATLNQANPNLHTEQEFLCPSIPVEVEDQQVPIVLSVAGNDFLLLQINEQLQYGESSRRKVNARTPEETQESEHENAYITNLMALFDNDKILNLSLRKLFSIIRTDDDLIELHEFGEIDELVLEIPQLNIRISEDNVYCRDILINDFTRIFNALKYKTLSSLMCPTYLNFRVSTQRRFITTFNALNDLIRAGFGFENITTSKKRRLENSSSYHYNQHQAQHDDRYNRNDNYNDNDESYEQSNKNLFEDYDNKRTKLTSS